MAVVETGNFELRVLERLVLLLIFVSSWGMFDAEG